MEYQLIDDERYSEADLGVNGNHKIGSLYDLVPAPENKQVNPPGEWNKARIIVDGMHVEHWLNGKKLLAYERGSDAYRALVARSKYKDLKNFGEMSQGHSMLQGHKSEVAFRKIKIRVW